MDHSARTAALRTAKTIIASHGISYHLNKYHRDQLARNTDDSSNGVRYDFQLDPARDSWHSSNPGCSICVNYVAESSSGKPDETGAIVLDSNLRVTVSATASDMNVEVFRQREEMISLLSMLCDILTATLPATVRSILETPEENVEKTRRRAEQAVGTKIVTNIGGVVELKGLRRGGAGRSFRLTDSYSNTYGQYPDQGTYRYRHVKSVYRHGNPREITNYVFRVFASTPDRPPLVTAHRLEDEKR